MTSPAPSSRGPLVLLAEPDARVRAHAREALEHLGLHVVEAADGEAALDALASASPYLAILAAELPGTGGLAIMERIRRDPALHVAATVLVAPPDDHAILERAFDAGAAEVVRRPLDGLVLAHRVRGILERLASRDALRRSRERLRYLERVARVAMWECTLPSGRLHGSPELRRLFGLRPEDGPVTAELLLSRIHPEDRLAARTAAEDCLRERKRTSVDTRVRLPDGTERYLHIRAQVVMGPDGEPQRLAGTVQDISERMRAEQQVRFFADHDSLTGLCNRRSFVERLRDALLHAQRHGRSAALLFVDLDDFKRINDTLGHSVGDELLKGVAERILHSTRQTDLVARREDGSSAGTVSRLGGDEFTILLSEIASTDDAARVASRIIEVLREPFEIEGKELVVGASIGITVFPLDGDDVETLLRNADTAMYQAKQQGKNNFQFFTRSMNSAASKRMTLERKLRAALDGDQMELHYQPQVDMATGRVTGAEALLRWRDPEMGLVSPAEFIPMAEETGLIIDIGKWTLETASRQCKAWREKGLPPIRLAINVSPLHIQREPLAETLVQTLWDSGIAAEHLEVEITEYALMQDEDMVIRVLQDLKRIGVAIALDDFGTGYSSLSYLKRFPVDAVKIDRSFVRHLAFDSDDAGITAAIISIAKTLRLRVIAEGVETEPQRRFLAARGCDEMQGYLFSPPVPPPEFEEILRRSPPAD